MKNMVSTTVWLLATAFMTFEVDWKILFQNLSKTVIQLWNLTAKDFQIEFFWPSTKCKRNHSKVKTKWEKLNSLLNLNLYWNGCWIALTQNEYEFQRFTISTSLLYCLVKVTGERFTEKEKLNVNKKLFSSNYWSDCNSIQSFNKLHSQLQKRDKGLVKVLKNSTICKIIWSAIFEILNMLSRGKYFYRWYSAVRAYHPSVE